jgi:hypothetical protein
MLQKNQLSPEALSNSSKVQMLQKNQLKSAKKRIFHKFFIVHNAVRFAAIRTMLWLLRKQYQQITLKYAVGK